MEALERERRETELRRKEEGVDGSGGEGKGKDKVLTKAEEGRKRKLEERRALIEAKRIKVRLKSAHLCGPLPLGS